jgi:hypothetical protein
MRSIRVVLAFVITIVTVVSPSMADAAGSTSVVISEVMTATSDNASNEFIELYNPTSQTVSMAGWSIEYKAATSTDVASNWTKRATLNGVIAARGFYLAAPRSLYGDSDTDWSATMAASGGNIRLKDDHGSVVDRLGYGATANAAETLASVAPLAGQSIERLPGRTDELAGNGVDTDNNALDFLIRQAPLPQSTKADLEDLGGAEILPDEAITEDRDIPAHVLPLEITELLPNPASPLTDADDEFIEIFNPNDVAVDYGGYKLKGGSDFHTSYTLPAGTLGPGKYTAFTSDKTHIGMTNSGGAVQLLDPDGALIDQTSAYDTAADGQSWAKVGDIWEWSLQPTPGSENVIMAPISPAAVAAAKAAAKTAKPKTITTKSTAKKAAKPKASSKAKAAAKKKSGPVQVAAAQLRPVTWLIIVLTLLTIGYAIYEFRYDIQNYYYKLRRDHRVREETVTTSKRGRDD